MVGGKEIEAAAVVSGNRTLRLAFFVANHLHLGGIASLFEIVIILLVLREMCARLSPQSASGPVALGIRVAWRRRCQKE